MPCRIADPVPNDVLVSRSRRPQRRRRGATAARRPRLQCDSRRDDDDRDRGRIPERVIGATVDAALFPMLGTPPLLGRVFENAEVGESPARVAIMAHALWQRPYGADRAIIGRSIVVDGNPFTVIGVMPAASRYAKTDPTASSGWSLRVVPLREMIVGSVRKPLLTAFACVLALLFIVCLNVSSAALARIVSRRHALGVRVALGASPAVLRELLFSESVFLALISGRWHSR